MKLVDRIELLMLMFQVLLNEGTYYHPKRIKDKGMNQI